jgi:hypothetical protein
MGLAIMPPQLEVTEVTVTGADARRDFGSDMSRSLQTAIERTLTHGNLLYRPPDLADSVLTADQELALSLSRARRSVAYAYREAGASVGQDGSVSIPVNPEVGEFADRAGTDFLLFVRGTASTESKGVEALDQLVELAALLIFGDDDDAEKEKPPKPEPDLPEPDLLTLEIGIVEASSARLVWYSRREGRVDLRKLESLQVACRATLANILVPSREPLAGCGAIGISITCRSWPIRLIRVSPDKVCFVDASDADSLRRTGWWESTSAEEGQIYFLNVRPGSYAVTACFHRRSRLSGDLLSDQRYDWPDGTESATTHSTILSEETVRLTAIDVAPGRFAFMGEFVVRETQDVDGDDTIPAHYFTTFVKDRGPGLYGHDNMGVRGSTLEKVKQGREAELKFLTKALEHFQGTGWTAMIRDRLAELTEAPEPVAGLTPANALSRPLDPGRSGRRSLQPIEIHR